MKKSLVLFILICSYQLSVVFADDVDLAPHSGSAYLMDYESGEVMYEKNADEKMFPASMTKMMSLILVMEQIHSGALKWDDEVVASSYAASMGGSQIFLQENEVLSVEELVKSATIASANDAITALSEKVGGTVENFVRLMNKKAGELGCTNTNFVNPTGLHDDQHYSSAKDMAIIAQALIREGADDILQYSSKYEDYIREDSDNKFWLVNTNKMIRTYEGMDGLKTGYTSQSKYCITVSALRDNLRCIGVVMNVDNKENRTKDVSALLDYAFASYKSTQDKPKQSEIVEIKIEKGKPSQTTLVTLEELNHLDKIGNEKSVVNEKVTLLKSHAPIFINEVIGELEVEYSDGSHKIVKLGVQEDVKALSYIDLWILALSNVFAC